MIDDQVLAGQGCSFTLFFNYKQKYEIRYEYIVFVAGGKSETNRLLTMVGTF